MLPQTLLAEHSPQIQELALAARRRVLEVNPQAHEEVESGWGGYLLFKQLAGAGTTVCWLSLHKKHVSLGFSQGGELADPAGLLQGTGKNSRHVKLKALQDVARPELRGLLVQAWAGQPDPEFLTAALQRIRTICTTFPNTSEKLSHGHPTFFFKNRSFAVYGIYSPSIAFKPPVSAALELATDERFFPTPYMAQNGWWSLRLTPEVDWDEVTALLEGSYRRACQR